MNNQEVVTISLKRQSNNNKNRKSWVAEAYFQDNKLKYDFLSPESGYEDEFLIFLLANGFYVRCDLGKKDFIQIKNKQIQVIDFESLKEGATHISSFDLYKEKLEILYPILEEIEKLDDNLNRLQTKEEFYQLFHEATDKSTYLSFFGSYLEEAKKHLEKLKYKDSN